MRAIGAIGLASLAAGCVQPAYVTPGPIQLQAYPPPVAYRSSPNDLAPPPVPLQAPQPVQPLPPPTPAPTVTEVPPDDLGPIPVQDMPTPTSEPTAPAPSTASTQAPTPATPEVVRIAPSSGPGSNVPLEGFRPMKGQVRPAP